MAVLVVAKYDYNLPHQASPSPLDQARKSQWGRLRPSGGFSSPGLDPSGSHTEPGVGLGSCILLITTTRTFYLRRNQRRERAQSLRLDVHSLWMNNKIYHHFERMVYCFRKLSGSALSLVLQLLGTSSIAVYYHHIHVLSTIIYATNTNRSCRG